MTDDDPPPTIRVTPPAPAAVTGMNEPPLGADNYRIGPEIARGGMGSVLQAEDGKLKRTVAIKVMHLDVDVDPAMRRRFLREAEVLAMLAHPNIVPIHDIVWEDGKPLFYSMKRVQGRTLQHILNDLRERQPGALRDFTLERLLLILRKACDALAFAHSKGVLHRDLKPENIMVGEFGEVLVMDWGIAKWRNGETLMPTDETGVNGPDPSSFDIRNSSFTLQGSVMGTPQYMSPEQAEGQTDEIDERSDIYSLGGILYAILTLRPPVEGSTLQEVLDKARSGGITSPSSLGTAADSRVKRGPLEAKQHHPLPHLRAGRVPPALSSVAMQALRLEKERRYRNVADFSADIEAYQNGFATTAEQAGALTQLKLLMLRHKAVTASLAALLLVSAGFVLKVMASERKATRHAGIAMLNERKADAEAGKARRSLAQAQNALAEAAFRHADLAAMVKALDGCPEDLRDQTWHYLSAKRDSSLGDLALPGFEDPSCIKAVPGQPGLFALADRQGRVAFVSAVERRVLRVLETGCSGMLLLSFDLDGSRLLAVSAAGGMARVFDTASGVETAKLDLALVDVSVAALSPDGGRAFFASRSPARTCIQHLIRVADGGILWKHEGPKIIHAAFLHDGGRIWLAFAPERQLHLVDASNGDIITKTNIYVLSIDLSPDGALLAVGCAGGDAVIFDARAGVELRRGRLHGSGALAVAWTRDRCLITLGIEGNNDNRIPTVLRLWRGENLDACGTLFGLNTTHEHKRGGWAFQPASGHLLTLQAPPRLWHIPSGQEIHRFTHRSNQGWSCRFLSDIIVLKRDNQYSLQRVDLTEPASPRPLAPVFDRGCAMCAFAPRAGLLALGKRTGNPPHYVQLMRLEEDHGLKQLWQKKLPGWTHQMDFDSAEERLALALQYQGGIILSAATGEVLLNIPQPLEHAVFAGAPERLAAISPGSRANEQVEDHLLLLDPADGAVIARETVRFRLESLAVSPDRRFIACAGDEQMVEIRDANTLAVLHRFRVHDAAVSALAFHPSLPVIATASADLSVKLWDYEEVRLLRHFMALGGRPIMLAFSPDGNRLAVEAQETVFRIYDVAKDAPQIVNPNLPPPALSLPSKEER